MKIEWKNEWPGEATAVLLRVGEEAVVRARVGWAFNSWRVGVRTLSMTPWSHDIAPGVPFSDEPPTAVLDAASEWIRSNVKGIATEEPQPAPPPDATREPAPGWTKVHDGRYILGDSEVTRYSDGWWSVGYHDDFEDAEPEGPYPDLRTAQIAAEDSCVEYLRERADAYGYELRRKS